jgi:glutamine---fructose-6-phosphate transaminase (isomerizing)
MRDPASTGKFKIFLGGNMCGIFGYVGTEKKAAKTVLKGLKSLEYRGYDSWGIAVFGKSNGSSTPTKLIVKKLTGKIGNATIEDIPESTIGFGHTRWATHGGVTDKNAHPHTDCTETLAIIHNGIVENYDVIRKKLLTKGHIFKSDTDSEVVAHLIEEYKKTLSFTKAFQKAYIELEGLNAVIAMSTDEHMLIAARTGSPLVVGFGINENFIASDAPAFLQYTKQVHFLEDNQMALISEDKIKLFDAKTGEYIHPKKQHLNWTFEQAEKGHFPHFMLKEIYEQPGIIADIATSSASHAEQIAKVIKKSSDIHLIGCGTAHHACIAGDYLFSRIAKQNVMECVASEFTFRTHYLSKKSFVMALSQSGETMDTIEAAKFAKKSGATICTFVNSLGSTLYRMADIKLMLSAGPEKGVASTKAFTAKLAHLKLTAYALIGDIEEGRRRLMNLAKEMKRILSDKSVKEIQTLAKSIYKKEHLYVIGRGLSYPIALEIALKIKEISYIHAEGFAGGELKHGVIALIEKGTPCIVLAPRDETFGNALSGAMEMKARGGHIIGISDRNHDVFDTFIKVNNMGDATMIPNVLIGQLLAYYLTLNRGYDPDMPRNLAKSVTVK